MKLANDSSQLSSKNANKMGHPTFRHSKASS